MNLTHTLKLLAAGTLLGLSSSYAGHDTETDQNGVILADHDVVGYFTQGKPVVGSAKYAPQYGGFCAYGMTSGKKFEIDGKAFEIVDGKLYVNKNLDVYKAWVEYVPKHIAEANTEWPSVEDVNPEKL